MKKNKRVIARYRILKQKHRFLSVIIRRAVITGRRLAYQHPRYFRIIGFLRTTLLKTLRNAILRHKTLSNYISLRKDLSRPSLLPFPVFCLNMSIHAKTEYKLINDPHARNIRFYLYVATLCHVYVVGSLCLLVVSVDCGLRPSDF